MLVLALGIKLFQIAEVLTDVHLRAVGPAKRTFQIGAARKYGLRMRPGRAPICGRQPTRAPKHDALLLLGRKSEH